MSKRNVEPAVADECECVSGAISMGPLHERQKTTTTAADTVFQPHVPALARALSGLLMDGLLPTSATAPPLPHPLSPTPDLTPSPTGPQTPKTRQYQSKYPSLPTFCINLSISGVCHMIFNLLRWLRCQLVSYAEKTPEKCIN